MPVWDPYRYLALVLMQPKMQTHSNTLFFFFLSHCNLVYICLKFINHLENHLTVQLLMLAKSASQAVIIHVGSHVDLQPGNLKVSKMNDLDF